MNRLAFVGFGVLLLQLPAVMVSVQPCSAAWSWSSNDSNASEDGHDDDGHDHDEHDHDGHDHDDKGYGMAVTAGVSTLLVASYHFN
eukprot:Skav220252  [mRNA]  locus=scaffold1696:125076:130601:+ [translate_table: standard]